jgi:uncharacterized membrane protein YgcG
MHCRLTIQLLGLCVCPIAFGTGCRLITHEKPAGVMVKDAETNRPIPSAEVRISDPMMHPSHVPEPGQIAGNDGIARLDVAPNGKNPVFLEAGAKGYQSDSVMLDDSKIGQIEPASLFENVKRRPPAFTLALYSGEPFTVELAVPPGYRGLIKAEMALRDDIPCPLGQRQFRITVSTAGAAQVLGPAVLRRISPASYVARHADGAPIDGRMDATKVGFRWLKHEGDFEYYVVGTQREYDVLRQQLCPELESDEKPSQRGGGSKGGRGGRGGGGRGGGGTGIGGPGGSFQ